MSTYIILSRVSGKLELFNTFYILYDLFLIPIAIFLSLLAMSTQRDEWNLNVQDAAGKISFLGKSQGFGLHVKHVPIKNSTTNISLPDSLGLGFESILPVSIISFCLNFIGIRYVLHFLLEISTGSHIDDASLAAYNFSTSSKIEILHVVSAVFLRAWISDILWRRGKWETKVDLVIYENK